MICPSKFTSKQRFKDEYAQNLSIIRFSGIMGVLPSEQVWAELKIAFAIQLCDTKVAIGLLPESRLTKNISNNLFHCCSIADVNSDTSTQIGKPMEWLGEEMPSIATQPQWERLTDRFRSLGGFCCLSTALLQPTCSAWSLVMWGFLWMGRLEPCLYISNLLGAGSNICSMVSSTCQHGWTSFPLNGFTSSLMRAQLQQEEWRDLPPSNYHAEPFSFLNPGLYVSCCNHRIWATGPWSGLS